MHASHCSTVDGEESSAPRFDTWSALQEHNKTEHPPTCLHPGCGRVYRTNKGLKRHILKRHIDISRISEALGTASPSPLDTPQHEDSSDDVLIERQNNEHFSTLSTALFATGGWQNMQDPDPTMLKSGNYAMQNAVLPSVPVTFNSFDGAGDYAE